MNRTSTLICLLLAAGSMMAQRISVQPRPYSFGKATKIDALGKPEHGAPKVGGTVVFGDDFANGLAGNNGIGPWTTSGPDGAIWMYDTDGPNGDFSDPSEHITSTTFNNGFMIFDSNFANNGCTSAPPCNVLDGALVSPTLNLSATPHVHLIFEEALRWCCSAEPGHFVDVSTDGGLTWPTRFTIGYNAVMNTDIHVNEDIGTHTRDFDLTQAIAANPANVLIRINHEGTTSGNISHYHWQIDDFKLVESYTTDVSLLTTQVDQYPVNGDADLEYTVYPFGQVREMNMRARVQNGGSTTANNVTLTVDVQGTGGSVFNDSETIASIPAGGKDTITVNGYTPAAVADEYTVDFVLSSDGTDSLPDNNTGQLGFEVDPFLYGLDDGAATNPPLDNLEDAYVMGNVFWVENDATLYAIDVCVGSGSNSGAIIDGQILDANLDLVDITQEFTIATSNISATNQHKWIHLVFDTPVDLTGQSDYVAALEHFGGADNVFTAISGWSPAQVSFIYDPVAADWFYQFQTPMVRMNFDPTVGFGEYVLQGGITLGECFPNPANESVTIPYRLEKATDVQLSIYDVSGQLILTQREGRRGAGNHRIQVDTQSLSEGAYFYTLNAGGSVLTQRMTVVH